jgi:hypothetical protein
LQSAGQVRQFSPAPVSQTWFPQVPAVPLMQSGEQFEQSSPGSHWPSLSQETG